MFNLRCYIVKPKGILSLHRESFMSLIQLAVRGALFVEPSTSCFQVIFKQLPNVSVSLLLKNIPSIFDVVGRGKRSYYASRTSGAYSFLRVPVSVWCVLLILLCRSSDGGKQVESLMRQPLSQTGRQNVRRSYFLHSNRSRDKIEDGAIPAHTHGPR